MLVQSIRQYGRIDGRKQGVVGAFARSGKRKSEAIGANAVK